MKFVMIQEDIDAANRAREERRNPSTFSTPYVYVSKSCPVAQCINRMCPGHAAQVTGFEAYLDVGSDVAVKLPEAVQEFVAAYDQGYEVHPIEFEIEELECNNEK